MNDSFNHLIDFLRSYGIDQFKADRATAVLIHTAEPNKEKHNEILNDMIETATMFETQAAIIHLHIENETSLRTEYIKHIINMLLRIKRQIDEIQKENGYNFLLRDYTPSPLEKCNLAQDALVHVGYCKQPLKKLIAQKAEEKSIEQQRKAWIELKEKHRAQKSTIL